MDTKEFKKQYEIDLQSKSTESTQDDFNPNLAARQIAEEQFYDLAKMLKGTNHEDLIAYKDRYVRKLMGYILSVTIFENENKDINKDPFPIEIYSRYKSNKSTNDKVVDWSTRKEKEDSEISDYFAIRIVPSKEHSIFMAHGDSKLQELMNQREKVRKFISTISNRLSNKPNMTCKQYCNTYKSVIKKLKEIIPNDIKGQEATTLIDHYDDTEFIINSFFEEYKNTVEDIDEEYPYDYYSSMIKEYDSDTFETADLDSIIYELRDKNANEVVLYKLKKDIMNVFEQSQWLESFRYFY